MPKVLTKYHNKNSPFQRMSITLTKQRVRNRIQEINVYIRSLYLRLCVAASNVGARIVHGNRNRTVLTRPHFNKQHFRLVSSSVFGIYNQQGRVFTWRARRGGRSVPPAVQRVAASSASVAESVAGHVTRPAAHATMITWSIEGQPPSYHRRKPCGLQGK